MGAITSLTAYSIFTVLKNDFFAITSLTVLQYYSFESEFLVVGWAIERRIDGPVWFSIHVDIPSHPNRLGRPTQKMFFGKLKWEKQATEWV